MNNEPNKRKYDIYTILYKEQYRLKLGFLPLILSKGSLVIAIASYWFFDGQSVFLAYGVLLLLYYKAIFNLTKDGNQLSSFVYVWLAKLNKTLRTKKQKKQL